MQLTCKVQIKGKKALHEALVKAVRPDARPAAAQYGGSKWITLPDPGI